MQTNQVRELLLNGRVWKRMSNNRLEREHEIIGYFLNTEKISIPPFTFVKSEDVVTCPYAATVEFVNKFVFKDTIVNASAVVYQNCVGSVFLNCQYGDQKIQTYLSENFAPCEPPQAPVQIELKIDEPKLMSETKVVEQPKSAMQRPPQIVESPSMTQIELIEKHARAHVRQIEDRTMYAAHLATLTPEKLAKQIQCECNNDGTVCERLRMRRKDGALIIQRQPQQESWWTWLTNLVKPSKNC